MVACNATRKRRRCVSRSLEYLKTDEEPWILGRQKVGHGRLQATSWPQMCQKCAKSLRNSKLLAFASPMPWIGFTAVAGEVSLAVRSDSRDGPQSKSQLHRSVASRIGTHKLAIFITNAFSHRPLVCLSVLHLLSALQSHEDRNPPDHCEAPGTSPLESLNPNQQGPR